MQDWEVVMWMGLGMFALAGGGLFLLGEHDYRRHRRRLDAQRAKKPA